MEEGARDNSDYRKKRRKRIKQIIVTFFVIMFLFPIVLSVILLFRMNRLERQVETLISQNGGERHYSTEVPDVVKAEEKEQKEDIVSEPAVDVEQVKKVYLTFDDGPSEETNKVLDILKKKNIKATFFVIGRQDEYSKKIYKRIVKEGHTLGMHSYSHIYKEIYGSSEQFENDFQRISDLLFDVTGVRSAYYRFPGGSSSTGELPMQECCDFLNQQGVTYLDWNVIAANGADENVSKKEMVQSVMDGVSRYDTSIVLLYDSADKKMTAKSLEAIIDALQAGEYEILPIDANTTPVRHS